MNFFLNVGLWAKFARDSMGILSYFYGFKHQTQKSGIVSFSMELLISKYGKPLCGIILETHYNS